MTDQPTLSAPMKKQIFQTVLLFFASAFFFSIPYIIDALDIGLSLPALFTGAAAVTLFIGGFINIWSVSENSVTTHTKTSEIQNERSTIRKN